MNNAQMDDDAWRLDGVLDMGDSIIPMIVKMSCDHEIFKMACMKEFVSFRGYASKEDREFQEFISRNRIRYAAEMADRERAENERKMEAKKYAREEENRKAWIRKDPGVEKARNRFLERKRMERDRLFRQRKVENCFRHIWKNDSAEIVNDTSSARHGMPGAYICIRCYGRTCMEQLIARRENGAPDDFSILNKRKTVRKYL